jgi:signal transduction histidine kinase
MDAIERSIATRTEFSIEYRVVREDGEVRWLQDRGRIILGADGEPRYATGAVMDVTARRQLEDHERALSEERARLIRELEQANRFKDEFLAMLSHELRTPLNVIVGWTDLLVNGGLDEEATRRALVTIQRNAQVQKNLVDDLLDAARLISGKLQLEPKEMMLSTIIEAAADSVQLDAAAKKIEVRIGIVEACGKVTADVDPDRMQQVFGNLLSNAVKFTAAGGAVDVSLRRCEGFAEVEVHDTGVGIAASELPFIFDRFWQSTTHPRREQSQGLGLGLAIVRQLVELHGGTVEASSPGVGRGATFTVRLPLGKQRPRSEAAA